MAKRSPLAEKLDEVKDRIAAACAKAKREPAEVTLIAVTKTAAPEQIREIMQLGIGDIGESRVQQLVQRAGQLNEFHQRRLTHGDAPIAERLRWHMIGHLQRNKIKQRAADGQPDSQRRFAAACRGIGNAGGKIEQTATGTDADQCIGRSAKKRRRGWRCRASGRADRFDAAPATHGPDDHGRA